MHYTLQKYAKVKAGTWKSPVWNGKTSSKPSVFGFKMLIFQGVFYFGVKGRHLYSPLSEPKKSGIEILASGVMSPDVYDCLSGGFNPFEKYELVKINSFLKLELSKRLKWENPQIQGFGLFRTSRNEAKSRVPASKMAGKEHFNRFLGRLDLSILSLGLQVQRWPVWQSQNMNSIGYHLSCDMNPKGSIWIEGLQKSSCRGASPVIINPWQLWK